MKEIIFLIIVLLYTPICVVYSQENDTLTDSHHNEIYKSVVIGNSIWMTENLNVAKFRNGGSIPHAKNDEEWKKAGKEGKPAWCYYNNDPANGEKFGKLYNWYAVNDPRGLAPEGWEIPTHEDFILFLGTFGNNGNKAFHALIEIDSSSVNALLGGWRYYDGSFYTIFNNAYLWLSLGTDDMEDKNNGSAYYMGITSYNESVETYFDNKGLGLSVRCIKK
jgi:uncharacterized protein (TIGR02145 family)